MQCPHYDAGRCHSCTLLEIDYPTQVLDKERHVAALLEPVSTGLTWLPAVTGAESGFRNKAKMVVSGTVAAPVLGILDGAGRGVDLTDCGLYPTALEASFGPLAAFVTRANLEPYQVSGRGRRAQQRGELKYLLVTLSPDGELMVRFVLRSQEAVTRIRKHLPWLQAELPALAVASVNIQPAHAAVLEGDLEIPLTERTTLPMRIDDITLDLRPQSFFQTNTAVATELYRQARAWVDEVGPTSLWDLYCGVGGFALHCAAPGRAVTGIEISAEAVVAASGTAERLRAGADGDRFRDVEFAAGDATAFAVGPDARELPEMVIVNPPRRGIGAELAGWLESSGIEHVLYSSCNATTLARDLAAMPTLRPVRGRLLDMFPQTSHYEVLVLLARS
ncbi:23S rRNA (uracil(747)-C(5))-methyltransferase RlmC [Promicromonospora citrea]|uniref:23S rRNA (Uracil(747)-C(5))-methyltransferase RlmC n=1 Tax=Promicromonospora citrea TaxID=43677 RepID=A0A8H9GED9_9MICO|nr:23S rRNA (uracil(747)-C(5))-methyltransferase RlmC [Promicromonospora citrea]NNH50663.1 23S rRNA (uracil(747)-C(5))-methyltransferase RlmC [Promicromonospora citrea]GGM11243.1 23S rRNA (uracil(747)-C(5))-methyltransferase RlmC [Promicromonospora citrea]